MRCGPLWGRLFFTILHHMPEKQKLIVIVGPTASGKTGLSIEIAKHIGGEVISADSRQVYSGFDLGSGKVTKREMQGVPHHCLDIASPRSTVSVERWRRCAEKAIRGIIRRGHVPIIAGGTGFYIDALVFGTDFPTVAPNHALRQSLAGATTGELLEKLTALDPERAATIEQKNPRRLVRAIEVATALGSVPPLPPLSSPASKWGEVVWVGLNPPKDELHEKIHARILSRLKQGMLAEVRKLHAGTHQAPLSWKRLEHFGLEYRFLALYLQGALSKEAMIEELDRATRRYARRQMTWWKRNKKIQWFESADEALVQWCAREKNAKRKT